MPGRPPKLALLRDPYCIGAAGQGPCARTDRGAEEGQAEAAGHRGLSRNQKPTLRDAHHPPPWRRRGRHEDGLHPSLGSELTTCLICQYSTDGRPSLFLPLPPAPARPAPLTHTYARTPTLTYSGAHSHSGIHARVCTLTCTHTPTRVCVLAPMCVHTRKYPRLNTRMHTLAHTHRITRAGRGQGGGTPHRVLSPSTHDCPAGMGDPGRVPRQGAGGCWPGVRTDRRGPLGFPVPGALRWPRPQPLHPASPRLAASSAPLSPRPPPPPAATFSCEV